MKRYRDAATGEFVTEEYALANPGTTIAETVLTPEEKQSRLATLSAKRASCYQYPNGPVKGGYGARLEAINAEIARLEGEAEGGE